jgi:2-octaprenyl-6-methoxyphenol hydroxylase
VAAELDAVVVGAGVAGATLAIGLARLGLRVATVDARSPTAAAPGRDVRGLALAPSSEHLLARLDLWSALAPYLVPLKHIVITDRGQFGSAVLHASDVGVPALGHVCPADRLLARLDAALALDPACANHWHSTVTGIAVAGDRVSVTLGSADGAATTLEAGLLVAADGMQSFVRRHFDIGVTTRDYGQTAIVANVDVERPAPDTAFERFTREGPLAVLPLGGARVVVVRAARSAEAEHLMRLPADDFLADVQQRFGQRLGRFTRLGERHAWPLMLNRANTLQAPRSVLVGNAANTIHPNGAQGLNLGLRDVATLLDCVATALARGEDPGAPAVLAEYARRREPDHARTVRFSDGLARLFGADFAPLNATRGAALLACDLLPPLKRALTWRLMGLRGEKNAWLRAPD